MLPGVAKLQDMNTFFNTTTYDAAAENFELEAREEAEAMQLLVEERNRQGEEEKLREEQKEEEDGSFSSLISGLGAHLHTRHLHGAASSRGAAMLLAELEEEELAEEMGLEAGEQSNESGVVYEA